MMPRLKLQWRGSAHMPRVGGWWRALLREASVFGAAVVVLVPAARGSHEWLGWLPLWLLAMPALACWVAHGAPLPRLYWQQQPASRVNGLRRTHGPQARRRRRVLRPVMTIGRGQAVAVCASVPAR